MAFKNEFNLLCNNSVTNSWTNDAISFDGVSFDEKTGAVTELKLRGACLYGTLEANNSLFSLHQLRYLDLSYNNIFSSFPSEFGRLSNLEFLDLHQNGFTGEVPSSISNLSRLTYLDLANNKFTSGFPYVYNLTKLSSLDLSNNTFEGKVPEWLWNLPSLTAMSLSHNSLNSFEGSPKASLNSPLVYLLLSSNAFQGSFPNISPSMRYIAAANNNFTGDIPLSMCNPRNLLYVDLSNNSFSGSVPRCLSESLVLLNLRHNNLRRLPDTFSNSSLKMLDVGHNKIRGKLPRSLASCKSLEMINMESNRINDTFPFWMTALPNLQVIVLRSNRFHGPIYSPQHHPLSFPELRIFDISRNEFDGSLPPNYFVNWSTVLIRGLEYDGRPRYIGDSYSLGYHPFIVLNIKGTSIKLEKILTIWAFVDFSGNRLGGQIPESIGLLKSLVALNLSNNDFTGQIPSSMAKLTELESLDLSKNQLSGNIPQELTNLSFLEILDMSYNKLTGQIPQGIQYMRQCVASFEGNINLCGPPLEKSCSEKKGAPSPQTQEQLKPPKQAHNLNSKATTIGYGSTLILMMIFGHVVRTWDKLYITIYIDACV
ncbi:PREDICTED: receptor-like protein 12 [Camelina sativa]|uniref:Receptor-like protein 12 n=1 Tax=Camelina sativa TaxID=90675 RepID=A0ABM0VXK0_CAMSA|nr:PREDICTED: receptor-like protein 12 [Camelina sativa]